MDLNRFVGSVYVHLPFCKSRCPYCDFFSTTGALPSARYLAALKAEWEARRCGDEQELRTLYVGGGTPSIWPPFELEELVSGFSFADGCEVTVEVNPGDADADWFARLAAVGVNRFSIGAQAFDDARLAWLGRRHGVLDVEKAVAFAKAERCAVSVDIIYGTPGQTKELLPRELKRAVELGVDHISAYELSIPAGSTLDRRLTQRERKTIEDDERSTALWHTVGDTLGKAGWERYEVSSYCRLGFRSQHNQVYWRGDPYVGLGAGAHGFYRGDGRFVRCANANDVDDYLNGVRILEGPSRPVGRNGSCEEVSREGHALELVMLGLRFAGGVDLSRLDELLSPDHKAKWEERFDSWLKSGAVVSRGTTLLPTPRGMLHADGMAAELIV